MLLLGAPLLGIAIRVFTAEYIIVQLRIPGIFILFSGCHIDLFALPFPHHTGDQHTAGVLQAAVAVKKIGAEDKVKKHLFELGIVAGSRVTVLASDGGNVILLVKEGRLPARFPAPVPADALPLYKDIPFLVTVAAGVAVTVFSLVWRLT